MDIVRGHFIGTGNDIYLCLGGVPDRIEFWNLTTPTNADNVDYSLWDKIMVHASETTEGISILGSNGVVYDHANTEGVTPYHGGDLMTSSNQTTTTYGDGIYIRPDDKDYRFFTNTDAGFDGDASTEDIISWKLDSNGSQTGHFNENSTGGDVVGTYIGNGSIIRIRTKDRRVTYDAVITTLTAGEGSGTDEVTLTFDVPSGDVMFIGGKYGCKPVPLGEVTTPGYKIVTSSYLNVSDDVFGFTAWMK